MQKKPKVVIYLGMALLGIVSPFCSCSTIPVFISFASLGVPTGALFVFLITSPMVQEASLILLLTEFGIPVATVYIILGVLTGIIVGTIISKAKDSSLFKEIVLAEREHRLNKSRTKSSCCDTKKVQKQAVVSIHSFILLSAALKKSALIKFAIFLSLAIIAVGYIFN